MAFNKRNRINLVLVVVVVILATLSHFRPGAKHAPVTAPLIQLKPVEIKDIRIELPGQKPVALTLGDRGWQMTAPLTMPADPNMVKTLLDYLDAQSQDSFRARGDLARFGLEKPVGKLMLNGAEYDFGGLQPVDNLQYVLNDGTIHSRQ